MKYIKKYEERVYNADNLKLVRCNWCDWIGEEEELKNNYECPNCDQSDEYLMDLDDKQIEEYITTKKYNL